MSSIRQFEDLPNELFFELLSYFDVEELVRSFWNLNKRLNGILRSLTNLSLTIDRNPSASAQIFAEQIGKLTVTSSTRPDLRRFVNLRVLEMVQAGASNLPEIRSEMFVKLVELRLSTSFDFALPNDLLTEIFHGGFSSLRRVHLCRVDAFRSSNLVSHSIEELKLILVDPNVVPELLHSCPNLRSLNVTFFGQKERLLPPTSSNFDHPLSQLTIRDPFEKLAQQSLAALFLYAPHLRRLDLQFSCRSSADELFRSFGELEEFRCDVFEPPHAGRVDFETIRTRRDYFQHLQSDEDAKGFRRIFTE